MLELTVEEVQIGDVKKRICRYTFISECLMLDDFFDKPDIIEEININLKYEVRQAVIKAGIEELIGEIMNRNQYAVDPIVDSIILETPLYPEGQPMMLIHPADFSKRMQMPGFIHRLQWIDPKGGREGRYA